MLMTLYVSYVCTLKPHMNGISHKSSSQQEPQGKCRIKVNYQLANYIHLQLVARTVLYQDLA